MISQCYNQIKKANIRAVGKMADKYGSEKRDFDVSELLQCLECLRKDLLSLPLIQLSADR